MLRDCPGPAGQPAGFGGAGISAISTTSSEQTALPGLITLSNDLIVLSAGDDNLTALLKLTDHADNLLLRFLNITHPDIMQVLDIGFDGFRAFSKTYCAE